MQKATNYTLLIVLFLWMVFGMFAVVVLNFFAAIFTPWLLAAPVFFTLFALFTVKRVVLNPKVKVSALMASKTLRLLGSMVVILLYILLVKVNSVAFVVTFGVYFILYLIIETLIMIRINRKKLNHA
jgi:hypothetical protein